MFKRWGLLVVTALFLCSCAGTTEVTGAKGVTAPGEPATEATASGDPTEEERSARDQELQGYQKQRQVEMQQMMMKRMMQGGTQGNRPVQIGPPGGGGRP